MAKRKWTQYTPDEKASIVVMLEASGYPSKNGALSFVGKKTGVPLSTLRDWYINRDNAVFTNIRNNKKSDLIERLDELIDKTIEHAFTVMSGAEFKDAVTGAAILIDKRQLLKGESTSNVNQHVIIEYAEDIVTEAATVADERYQASEAI